MLSVKECMDYCELSEEEIQAIAEHEGIPEVLAAELGECLLKSDVGTWLIKRYIADDLERAEHTGHGLRVAELRKVLEEFSRAHPTYDLRRS
jgi:hypothetical protein